MGRFLKVFGAISVIVVVSLGLLFSVVIVKGNALDRESKTYAQSIVNSIITSWDEEALIRCASPQFMAVTPRTQLDEFFGRARQLGRLKECDQLQGQASFSLTSWSGKSENAAYTDNCNFQRGTARIYLNLVKNGEDWIIVGFNVTPLSAHHPFAS
jgi:hypothetical protein